MTHFAQSFGFDLANSFAGDLELLANFLKGAAVAVDEAEALFEDGAFALSEGVEDVLDLVLEHGHTGHLHRIVGRLVFDKISEAGVVAVADWGLQRDRLLGHLENGTHALDGKVDLVGDLVGTWLAAVLLNQLLLHAHQLVDGFDHVHRNANGARLISDRAGDRLTDPPGGVGGEFVAAAVLEFFHRFHQAHVAFLDQVEKGEAAIGIFFWQSR